MIGSKEDPRLVRAEEAYHRAYQEFKAAQAQLGRVVETLDKESGDER